MLRAPRVFAKRGDFIGKNLLRAIAIFAITASGQVSFAATYNYSFGTERYCQMLCTAL